MNEPQSEPSEIHACSVLPWLLRQSACHYNITRMTNHDFAYICSITQKQSVTVETGTGTFSQRHR